MTNEELIKHAESELARRVREADETAILAAEAFAFGLADEYMTARKADILRRLNERYPNSDSGSSGADS